VCDTIFVCEYVGVPTRAPPVIEFDEAADIDEIDFVTSYIRARGLGQCELVRKLVSLLNPINPHKIEQTSGERMA